MDFKELTIEELAQGYIWNEETGLYQCIFCGETFEEGLIYRSRNRMASARRTVAEHILDNHNGVFYGLLTLDKQIHGLSDSQKDILEGMYLEKGNREVSEEMGISAATVRNHKFHIQRMKREARILLALLEQIENEQIVRERKHLEQPKTEESFGCSKPYSNEPEFTESLQPSLTGNSLHPFFTQYNLK